MPVVKEYSTIAEFIKSVDDAIAELRKVLGEHLRKIEELRVRVEQEAKLKSVISRLGLTAAPSGTELSLKTIKIVVNPTAEQELAMLEQALESINNRLTQLTALRKDLDALAPLSDVNVKITVVYVDGIPKNIILRIA
jgi:prefoldin subunit 5